MSILNIKVILFCLICHVRHLKTSRYLCERTDVRIWKLAVLWKTIRSDLRWIGIIDLILDARFLKISVILSKIHVGRGIRIVTTRWSWVAKWFNASVIGVFVFYWTRSRKSSELNYTFLATCYQSQSCFLNWVF